MRCDQCNKFASYDDSNEPEINSEDIDNDGAISIDARIYLSCADCGQELKEASFNLDSGVPDEIAEAHKGEGHKFELEVSDQELTSKSGNFKKGVFVPQYGRYAKTFYCVRLTATVRCECQYKDKAGVEVPYPDALFTVELEDDIQASSMDELV